MSVRLPGGRSATVGALLAVTGCASGTDRFVEPPACPAPVVARSAVAGNSTNVLSELVTADVRFADSVRVRFGMNSVLDSVTPTLAATSDSVSASVLGLLPSTTYDAQLVAFSHCGAASSEVLSFTTSALPSDLPRYTAVGSDPAPGYVVFAAGMYGLVIDNTGRVVWYHRFPNGPGLNFQPQPNGRYVARPQAEVGGVASWVEIAPDGRATRTLGCARGLQPRMHDMIAQADGSYWMLCDETRMMDLSSQGASPQASVLGTTVQWRNAAGDVLFDWSPFDHLAVDLVVLDPVDRTGPVINWTHGNALDLDADGNLFVSFRNLSQVTKIDTHTGAVVWRMGGIRNELTFENGGAPAFVHQHGLRVLGGGQLVLLDNLGEPLGSRAERYQVDDVRRTVRASGAYGTHSGIIAQVGGSTQVLANGHVLVSFGNGGGVKEYDAAGNMVWGLAGNAGYVFRAERIGSLYKPGVGDPR